MITEHTFTKQIDIDFLEVVHAAELIEFVVDFVVDERLVIVGRVVSDNVVYWTQTKQVYQ